jgi:hypothetical protein
MDRQVNKLQKAEELIKDGRATRALALVEAVRESIQKDIAKKDAKPKRDPSEHNKFIQETMSKLKLEFPDDKPQERLIKANALWVKQKQEATTVAAV